MGIQGSWIVDEGRDTCLLAYSVDKKKRVSMIFNQIANGKGKIAIAVALYL